METTFLAQSVNGSPFLIFPLNPVSSKWEWAFTNPGSSILSEQSIISSQGNSERSFFPPTALIRLPSTIIAPSFMRGEVIGNIQSALIFLIFHLVGLGIGW